MKLLTTLQVPTLIGAYVPPGAAGIEHNVLVMVLRPIGWHWPFVVTPAVMAELTAIAGSRAMGLREHNLPTLPAEGAEMVTVGRFVVPVT